MKTKIRMYREIAGLTIEKLAELSRCSTASLIRYELGTGNPSAKTLLKIAQVLNTPAETLMDVSCREDENEDDG